MIDMHQLTKNTKNIAANNTENSPKRTMTLFQLSRYLDYSCEMLALCSKISALYANGLKDEVNMCEDPEDCGVFLLVRDEGEITSKLVVTEILDPSEEID